MAMDADVRQALLHAQGRSIADLAAELGMTRQHAHRLLTGRPAPTPAKPTSTVRSRRGRAQRGMSPPTPSRR
jgi:Helix-turn-helix